MKHKKNWYRQFILLSIIHFLFWVNAGLLYWLSFREPQYITPIIIIGLGIVVSWFPYKTCPLSVWENRLREKLNISRPKFSMLHMRFIDRLLGGRLPRTFTVYAVFFSIFLRLIVK